MSIGVLSMNVVAGACGFTVMVTVSPLVRKFAGSPMLVMVILVVPFDQKASYGSVGATSLVPACVSSKKRTSPPAGMDFSFPSFQSEMVSPVASLWQRTTQFLAL